MNDDWLTKDFIDPRKVHIMLVCILVAIAIYLAGMGVRQFIDVHQALSSKVFKKSERTHGPLLEIGDLRLTAISGSGEHTPSNIYVSALNFDISTPSPQRRSIISKHDNTEQPLYGLRGAPSFNIKPNNLSFWRWQFYFQIFIQYGGLVIIFILLMLTSEIDLRRKTFFVKHLTYIALAYTILFTGGALLVWGDNLYVSHFLTSHYIFNQQNAPFPLTWLVTGAATLSLLAYLEQAVRLQKEQDLTI